MKTIVFGFSYNKKGLFPKLITFFTNSKFSHCFVVLPNICKMPSILEAGKRVEVAPFERQYLNNKNELYELWCLKTEALEADPVYAIRSVMVEFLGFIYGYLSLPWFIYSWFMLKFFKKDVSHKKNWFTGGVFCSELLFYVLVLSNKEVREKLSKFNPDTIQCENIRDLCIESPHLFEKISYEQAVTLVNWEVIND